MQLQLLTAIVKLFLKRPTDTQELVQQVLSLATQVTRVFYDAKINVSFQADVRGVVHVCISTGSVVNTE